jgi:hypothetical protein
VTPNAAEVILGTGDATSGATSGLLRGANISGTNAAGGNLTIRAARGTGTGAGGDIVFETAPAGPDSGTTPNAHVERLRIFSGGNIRLRTPGTGTSTRDVTLSAAEGGLRIGALVTFASSPAGAAIQLFSNDVDAPFPGNAYIDTGADNNASIYFRTAASAGSLTERMAVRNDGGVTIGSPTGASKGPGTLNAEAVYDDNVLLTCYVPELYRAGGDVSKIDRAEWADRAGQVNHEPLEEFLQRAEVLDPRVYAARWQETGVLPGFPGPEDWKRDGPLSVGKLLQKIWEHLELHAVHSAEVLKELDQLRAALPVPSPAPGGGR